MLATTTVPLEACVERAATSAAPSPVAFEDLYDDHVDWVWRCARRLGVSEAAVDDVVQSVFLVIHRRLSSFAGNSSLKTWIFSILLRVVQEHRRSTRRKSPHWLSEPTDPDSVSDNATHANPHSALERAEASRVIDELLEVLDGDKRVVFVMAELEQMTAPEISEATGLNPNVIYSRLRAARTEFERAASRLRRQMARRGGHD